MSFTQTASQPRTIQTDAEKTKQTISFSICWNLIFMKTMICNFMTVSLASVAEQVGSSLTWSNTPEDRFSRDVANYKIQKTVLWPGTAKPCKIEQHQHLRPRMVSRKTYRGCFTVHKSSPRAPTLSYLNTSRPTQRFPNPISAWSQKTYHSS